MSGKIIVVTPHGAPGSYAARLLGFDETLCVSRTPFLTAARELLKRGYDPSTIIVMRHAGSSTDCFRARLEAAAKLSVKEENGRPPRFVLWNDRDLGQGSARTAADEPAATYQPSSWSSRYERRPGPALHVR